VAESTDFAGGSIPMKAALTLNPSPKGGEGLRVRASPKKGEWGSEG